MQHHRDLVEFVNENADVMAQRWLEIVRRHSGTPTYHGWNEEELLDRAREVFTNLGAAIMKPSMKKPVAESYSALGLKRCREGFAVSEVVQALIITRRVLWFKVQAEGLMEMIQDPQLALEVSNRVVLFFDRALYFTAVGFERK